MTRKIWVMVIMVVAALVAGCASAAVATPTVAPTAIKTGPSLTAEPSRKADWDKTVASAKQEGKVVVYNTYGPGEMAALANGFREAYGITVESISGRGAEVREKLFRERRAGLYLVDFFMMGASGMILDLKPVGALDPIKPQLTLPEVLDTKKWYGGGQMFLDKEQTFVLAFGYRPQPPAVVNSDLVKPEDIKSFADLLQARWKGKIVLNDPTTTGGGQEWVQMVAKYLGFEFLRNLARQEPAISRDLRQQTEWVARGKYSVVLGPHPGAVSEFMNAGAPIKYIPSLREISWASTSAGNIALINRPAHPNAAKVFLNWLLTQEGQTAFSKSSLIHSTRLDVPTSHLDPLTVRQPGIEYFNSSAEDVALERDAIIDEASVILGLTVR